MLRRYTDSEQVSRRSTIKPSYIKRQWQVKGEGYVLLKSQVDGGQTRGNLAPAKAVEGERKNRVSSRAVTQYCIFPFLSCPFALPQALIPAVLTSDLSR